MDTITPDDRKLVEREAPWLLESAICDKDDERDVANLLTAVRADERGKVAGEPTSDETVALWETAYRASEMEGTLDQPVPPAAPEPSPLWTHLQSLDQARRNAPEDGPETVCVTREELEGARPTAAPETVEVVERLRRQSALEYQVGNHTAAESLSIAIDRLDADAAEIARLRGEVEVLTKQSERERFKGDPVELLAEALYNLCPCGDQETDLDGRPSGPGYAIYWSQLDEYSPADAEKIRAQARMLADPDAQHDLTADLAAANAKVAALRGAWPEKPTPEIIEAIEFAVYRYGDCDARGAERAAPYVYSALRALIERAG